ncbi:hypothetical protein [Pollutibacter soli]|uniref:hypothetical protein n=1 Tax=Pollutibacter soli TaxID=3034157 RepID=UPI003013DE9C
MKDTKTYPDYDDYLQPKGNVLVISCIDLRLTDNLLDFLHFDNLINRYDHLALAGASLCGTYEKNKSKFNPDAIKSFPSIPQWEKMIEDHVKVAKVLHKVSDIYIVEHEDCGAYKNFLADGNPKNREKEIDLHRKFADDLKKHIRSVHHHELHIHKFILDLRGNVSML